MMEMILVLATLLQRWRFEAAGPLPELSPAVTLRPKGPVPVRAIQRRG
jgi:cytochrome P450